MIQTAKQNKQGYFIITKKSTLLILALTMLSSFSLFAQKGEINGKVTDFSTGELLPGANIYIEGIGMGTSTNAEGEYKLSNIPEGTHKIVISYISYLTEKQEVTIKGNESINLDVVLAYDAVTLGEISITAQILGQARAMNQQLNSDAIVNVVSSDKIKELPDANAAEAIGRMSGVAVTRVGGEADKVVVRGLSPKLTSITINGVKVPSTSGTDRSVSLNMVSPELLSSIELYKSPTADMDGDAIGGVVNLGVMKAPEKPEATIRLNGGYNGLDNTYGNYKAAIDLSKRYFDKKLGVYAKANFENTNRSSESITNRYEIPENADSARWPITRSSLQDNSRIINRIGSSLGFDYQYKTGEITGLGFYSLRKTNIQTNRNNLDESSLVSHRPRHHKYNNSVIQGMLSGKQELKFMDINWLISSNKSISDNYYDIEVVIDEYGGQGSGEVHTIDEKLAKRTFDYSNAWLGATNVRPEVTEQNSYTAALDFKADFNLFGKLSGFVKFGGKYRYDDRTHDVEQYSIWQYYLDDDLNNVAAENMQPYETVRGGTNNNRIMMENFMSGTDKLGIWNNEYYVAPLMDMDYIDLWYDRQKGELEKNPDRTVEYREYEARETVTAGYLMTKINYGKWLSVIPGIRYEYSNNEYLGYFSTVQNDNSGIKRDSTVYKKYGELLPSFHIKVKPINWFDVRLSAVKTLARPDYDMITPRAMISTNRFRVAHANPNLKHAEAWNYDVIFSFFSNKLGLFSVGGFYKKFDNYFAQSNGVMTEEEARAHGYPIMAYEVTEQYLNFDNSKVYGFELDLQTNLDYLKPPFNGIVLSANVTKLWSSTYYPRFEKVEYWDPNIRQMVLDYENSQTVLDEGKLPDQKEWLSNFAIGYDYKGFSGRVSMIYQSPSLVGFSSSAESEGAKYTNLYDDEFFRIDASLSQKIGKHIKIMANLANINGASERRYQYQQQYWRSENRYGMTVDIGIQYKFF